MFCPSSFASYPQKNGGGIIHKIVEAAGIQSSDAVYEVLKRVQCETKGGLGLMTGELHVGVERKNATFWKRENRTKKAICVFVEHVVFAFGFKSVSHEWDPLLWCWLRKVHEELLWRTYKFPLLLTGGLWYWRANYATLATCSEGLLFRWGSKGAMKKVHIMNYEIPPPHPKQFVLFGHRWDFDLQTSGWAWMNFANVCAPKKNF